VVVADETRLEPTEMTSPSSSEQQDSAATCKAVVVDCPGIGKMKWCEQCAIYFGKDQPCPSSKEKLQPSPTWAEVDAIRKGKSDIDLAARIWQLERELRLLKRAHGDALKEWAYAEGLLKELQSATSANSKVLDVARSAICSIGSFDRGLQDHYQRKLNAATDNRSADKGQG